MARKRRSKDDAVSTASGEGTSGSPRRRGRIVAIVIVALLVVAGAGVLVWRLQKSDSNSTAEQDIPVLPSTTFPNPPATSNSTEETTAGVSKTTFTSQFDPTKVLDDYLANFATIGWTTLSRTGDNTAAVLKLQGGNRFATISVRATNTGSAGVSCQGNESAAVNACAGVS